MIRANAEVNLIGFLDAEAVLFRVVVDQLSDTVGLANRNDCSLGTQDGRHEVLSTNVTNGRNTESSIVEVCLNETSIGCPLRQVLQVIIDLQNALVLHLLDVGDGEAVGAINSNAIVVVVLEHVPLDVAIVVEIIIDVRVDYGELTHGDGACFDEEG